MGCTLFRSPKKSIIHDRYDIVGSSSKTRFKTLRFVNICENVIKYISPVKDQPWLAAVLFKLYNEFQIKRPLEKFQVDSQLYWKKIGFRCQKRDQISIKKFLIQTAVLPARKIGPNYQMGRNKKLVRPDEFLTSQNGLLGNNMGHLIQNNGQSGILYANVS